MRKTLCYMLAVLGLAVAMSARATALSLQERIHAIVAPYLEVERPCYFPTASQASN